ncbi:MAG: serine/threonine-protein kinase [Gammaproteobacteria bacterium]
MTSEHRHFRDALEPGDQVVWYVVREVLGQGAFGITYLCDDAEHGGVVAIKEYLPPFAARRSASNWLEPVSPAMRKDYTRGLERFIAECEHLKKCRHPNIVAVQDVFECNNTAYLVMTYAQGESLQSVLARRRRLSEGEVLGLLHPLFDALDTVHREGLVHRDIKPSNIFIRGDGAPLLLDFGSARPTLESESETVTNLVSPGYAPIEQYTGNSEKQGPWTDIYGLGATLYRMVTGTIPVQAMARAEALIHGAPDPYQAAGARAAAGYSDRLLSAIDQALMFRAYDRPQGIDSWRTAFAACEAAPVPVATVCSGMQGYVEAATVPQDVDAVLTHEATGRSFDRVPLRRRRPSRRWAAWLNAKPGRAQLAAAAVIIAGLGLLLGWKPAQLHSFYTSPGLAEFPAPDASHVPDNTTPFLVTLPSGASARGTGLDELELDTEMGPEQPVSMPATPDTGIEVLLSQARDDLMAERLTKPSGNNAYERYAEVLERDPGNREARDGMRRILARYLSFVYRDIEAKDLRRAHYFLQRAAELAPDAYQVKLARRAYFAARYPPSHERYGVRYVPESYGSYTAYTASRGYSRLEGLRRRIGDWFAR